MKPGPCRAVGPEGGAALPVVAGVPGEAPPVHEPVPRERVGWLLWASSSDVERCSAPAPEAGTAAAAAATGAHRRR
jgi:hypothetical protein